MNRSLLIVFVIGVIGMVMLAGMGSYLVGKVGGADVVEDLRRELSVVYGARLADPAALTVTMIREGDARGLRVCFAPDGETARRTGDLDRLLGRMSELALDRSGGGRVASFVTFRLAMPGGGTLERRFPRK